MTRLLSLSLAYLVEDPVSEPCLSTSKDIHQQSMWAKRWNNGWLNSGKTEATGVGTSVTPILPINIPKLNIDNKVVFWSMRTFRNMNQTVPNMHIPVDKLPSRVEEISQNSRIIFICQAGRAYSAAEFMTSIGATDIYVVNGGMSSDRNTQHRW